MSAVTRYARKKLNGLNILFNTRYSHHLTVYAWLKQRGQLCYYMLQQINSLGKVKGSDDHIREELANLPTYITIMALKEAEQYQCQSMQATFLLYESLYHLSELVHIPREHPTLDRCLTALPFSLPYTAEWHSFVGSDHQTNPDTDSSLGTSVRSECRPDSIEDIGTEGGRSSTMASPRFCTYSIFDWSSCSLICSSSSSSNWANEFKRRILPIRTIGSLCPSHP